MKAARKRTRKARTPGRFMFDVQRSFIATGSSYDSRLLCLDITQQFSADDTEGGCFHITPDDALALARALVWGVRNATERRVVVAEEV